MAAPDYGARGHDVTTSLSSQLPSGLWLNSACVARASPRGARADAAQNYDVEHYRHLLRDRLLEHDLLQRVVHYPLRDTAIPHRSAASSAGALVTFLAAATLR